jgi:hypothetical protein
MVEKYFYAAVTMIVGLFFNARLIVFYRPAKPKKCGKMPTAHSGIATN